MKKSVNLTVTIFLAFIALGSILHPQENTSAQRPKTYTIGYMKNIFYDVDLNDVQAALRMWVNETVKIYRGSHNYQLNNKIYENFKELTGALSSDNIAALSISINDYFQYGNKMGLKPILVPEIEGKIGVEFLLLVRKDAHYNSLKDLKGRTIGLISTPIYMPSSQWLDVLLAKNKLSGKEKHFGRMEESQRESQLILSLFFGNLDACVVSKSSFSLMKELNPQVGEKLISLDNSPPLLTGFLCYLKSNKDEEFKNLFCSSTIKLHELTFGRQILTLLKVGKLVPFKEEYLNSYKDLMRDYKRLVPKS